MLIDNNLVERYIAVLVAQQINWDSFELKIAMDETKVDMINLLFNVISNSDLYYVS